MAKQARINRGRPLLLHSVDITGDPDNGYESPEDATPLQVPHHVMSPRTAVGLITTGVVIGLTQPSQNPAVPVAGGFQLILWVANVTGYFWFRCTPVFLQYRDASVTFDINASALYFEIYPDSVQTPGDILFNILEQ